MKADLTAKEPTSRDSISLYVAIAAMAGVAATFVVITFSMFLHSQAYKTVQDIQTSSKINGSILGDYDTTSPVKTADIDETIKGIENKIDSLDNEADYGSSSVSDEALGAER